VSTGGMSAGGMSTGGGSGGSGGGAVTVQDIVPTLDGFLWVGTCADAGNAAGKDCPILSDTGTACVYNTPFASLGAFKLKKHTVGGTQGTKYLVNFEVRGVTGGKAYMGGTPQSTADISQTANDGWYVGGLPQESKWNTYEVHVSPPVPGQPVNTQALTCSGCPAVPDNVYYINSIPNAEAQQLHETFPIDTTASFPVLGGGTITLVIHDSNCLGQQNCGSDTNAADTAMCLAPRTIDLTGMSPQPAAPFAQPLAQAHPWYPQWLFFDVKSVTQQ
jgi:hypothetical protein